ncbi:tyramine beta-hydroxylase, partial [Aplysia californica]|uniref:Tyramine beta-hydroxylase n=1 Tax=Aplysia californica TaxID=6500 RepID=A0ABM0K6L9_APLCA
VLRITTLTSLLLCVTSYRHYQLKIPNGDAVPHPCKPNYIWKGVGHYQVAGTGVRNVFGEDFAAAGHEWTEELCRKDSDGDGLTNGQELGDPDCEWKKEGDIPKREREITHPGICDPWDSPTCFKRTLNHPIFDTQEKWMKEMCKADEFVCHAFNDTDLKTLNITFPPTPVPAKETTYICQVFEIPEGDFHMVATQPIIYNEGVLHHMSLFGCAGDEEITNQPFECDMLATQNCQDFISIWSVGLAGECYHPDAGVRIGINGYKKVALQFHWNNPEERADLIDASGMQIHYTPNRRPNDAGMLITGSNLFYLYPGQHEVQVTGKCTPTCTTNLLTGPIKITAAWNHMHYAGIKMNIEVLRNGTSLTYLTNDPIYSYDSPERYIKDTPVEILPGDEIITNCYYRTTGKKKTIVYGDATSDEMCFGLLTFFPKRNMLYALCISENDFIFCDAADYHGCPNMDNIYSEDYFTSQEIYKEVMSNCEPFSPCLPECEALLVNQSRENACFRGKPWDILQTEILNRHPSGIKFLQHTASCSRQVYAALNGNSGNIDNNTNNTTTNTTTNNNNNNTTTTTTNNNNNNNCNNNNNNNSNNNKGPGDSAGGLVAMSSLVFFSTFSLIVWFTL